MLKRPNFCCSCGEKIDRIEWHLWTSRRFCELCQSEYRFEEWLPRITGGFFLLAGLFGIGSLIGRDRVSADLRFAPADLALERALRAPAGRTDEALIRSTGRVADKAKPVPVSSDPVRDRPEERVPIPPAPDPAEVPAVLCGARTKKGTACTRKVKGGGRCWQHIGKEAFVPEPESADTAAK
ncbi:MAG: hypothetical protein IPM63_00165 [Acidobacteriota bacterium]|nr:MAG: hypothetical protein IPM63_00165 [Acidobacteriota bacterium]